MPTFIRRGDRWRAEVFKRGVRQSRSFDSKAAAQVWARRLEAEIDAGASAGHVASRDTVGR